MSACIPIYIVFTRYAFGCASFVLHISSTSEFMMINNMATLFFIFLSSAMKFAVTTTKFVIMFCRNENIFFL